MKVLCITDQFSESDHSSISGIFGTYLQRHCEVILVTFSREAPAAVLDGTDLIVPNSQKKRVFEAISGIIDIDTIDVVVVRNFITILWQALRNRSRYKFRVGFWHSFPHSYRRYFQARFEKKSVLRKGLEYRIRSILENRLVAQCDFLIAMSPEFRKIFYPAYSGKFLPLPMGVDFAQLPTAVQTNKSGMMRMIYTGTVDKLRQADLIMQAVSSLKEDFVLDIFTASRNETVDTIRSWGDYRIRLHAPLPRQSLFARISTYDVGIGAIPENELYEVSSPTKTLEYYALGVPAIVSFLPEYKRLFDHDTAFFCHFTVEDLGNACRQALQTPRSTLAEMGEKGRNIIFELRNYEKLASDVYRFFGEIQGTGC